ncbi:TetR/AcrR family transcriptional regulator C-terminal domain-containing protein [Streptomyces sp. NPDC047939]|uniref:TetR/AcrR family transcriptional regulator C-terminal domain-containing protein n=1 Tax=Streptomyces sp. NPDC047939 TaxID=3155381 RepID=UPI00341F7C04
MTLPDQPKPGSKGRRRGGPLRIGRPQIIAAARNLDPRNVTMQAVADELGVDRKALNYHVTDREGLLRLIATDAFETHFSRVEITSESSWQNAIRAWAVGVRDSMVATGVLAHYYRIQGEDLSVLRPATVVLERMLAGGFDATAAGRGLIFVTNFAMGVGRDIVLHQQPDGHPQASELRRALAAHADEGGYEALRDLALAGLNDHDDVQAQFDFEVDIFIRGMEQRLLDRA